MGRIAGLTETVTLAGGDCLFYEGDPSDALYAVEVGRLRVFRSAAERRGRRDTWSARSAVGSSSARPPSSTVGPAAPACTPSATPAWSGWPAIDYEALLQRDPRLGLHLARVALGRTRTTAEHRARQACFALVAASAGVDLDAFARELTSAWGPGAVVTQVGRRPAGARTRGAPE